MERANRFDGHARPRRAAGLARWGAVLSGAVVSVAVFAALAVMWLMIVAIGGTNGTSFIADNIAWFMLGSALLAALFGGFVGGYLEDVRGAGAGMWTGLGAWSVVVTATVAFLLPRLLGTLDATTAVAGVLRRYDPATLVALFVAYAGGLALAAIGGSYGGAAKRPRATFKVTPAAEAQMIDDLRVRLQERELVLVDERLNA
jgi:hypothetical protein